MQITHDLKVSEEQRIFLRDVLRMMVTEREGAISDIERGNEGYFRNTRDILVNQIRDGIVMLDLLDDVAKPDDDIPF